MAPPLAQLDLLPRDGQGIAGQCHLDILQADDRIILVAIPRTGGTWSERGYVPKDSKFVPRYPFRAQYPHNNSSGWPFTVVQSPRVPDVHDFATRKAALEFQRFITGYVDKGHCEEVVWDAMIMKRWGQNRKYIGEGEMQLWLPVEQAGSPPGSTAGQPDSEHSYLGPLPDLVRVQTGGSLSLASTRLVPQPNRNQTYFNRDRPPLLVAFLRDSKDRSKYTMMAISVADLTPNRNSEHPDMLTFQNDEGFKVKSLEADENNLNKKFDVGGFARNYSPDAESIKLVNLRISAQNQNHLRIFRGQLEEKMTKYSSRQQREAQLRDAISQGKAASPTSSALSVRDRRKSSASTISFLPRVDRSAVFPSEMLAGLDARSERHELPSGSANLASSSPPIGPTETGWGTGSTYLHAQAAPRPRPASQRTISLARSASTATASAPVRDRRPATPNSTFVSSSGSTISGNMSSIEDMSEVFIDLDTRIRRFMQHDPALGSADETIRRLHSLPGGPRALLYEFGSMPSFSDGTPQRRRFRCPFDIVYPQNGVNTGCQGPGFYPLERLWNHLEKQHFSYDCYNCLVDFHDDAGIDKHITDGCPVKSTALAKRVPYGRLMRIEQILRGDYTKSPLPDPGSLSESELERLREKEEIERWNKMWDVLFPSLAPNHFADAQIGHGPVATPRPSGKARPSPFISVPEISHDTNLARLEMLFAAMVENSPPTSDAAGRASTGAGNEMISKSNAKKYLRAAIQALVGEELDPWERVLPDAGIDLVGSSSPAIGGSWAVLTNGSGNRSEDAKLGPVARDFLRLMGSNQENSSR
ncbi:hypothetical protein V8F06_006167 [Rhypophila decipiens]